jgi:hypothetical protein
MAATFVRAAGHIDGAAITAEGQTPPHPMLMNPI